MIPLATTTITVRRPVAGQDPYEAPVPPPVMAGIPAHIGSPSGIDVRIGGDQQVVTDRLDCAIVDLRHGDTVHDDGNDVTYSVVWVRRRYGLGLDHMEAGLVQTEGAANG
jgi:hypothetical protein